MQIMIWKCYFLFSGAANITLLRRFEQSINCQLWCFMPLDVSSSCSYLLINWSVELFTSQAYDICVKKDLLREQVFILGRMGNTKRALAVIVNKLGDVEEVYIVSGLKSSDALFLFLFSWLGVLAAIRKRIIVVAGCGICNHAAWWWSVGRIN